MLNSKIVTKVEYLSRDVRSILNQYSRTTLPDKQDSSLVLKQMSSIWNKRPKETLLETKLTMMMKTQELVEVASGIVPATDIMIDNINGVDYVVLWFDRSVDTRLDWVKCTHATFAVSMHNFDNMDFTKIPDDVAGFDIKKSSESPFGEELRYESFVTSELVYPLSTRIPFEVFIPSDEYNVPEIITGSGTDIRIAKIKLSTIDVKNDLYMYGWTDKFQHILKQNIEQ